MKGPLKGPLNTCLKDRYALIEQSDLGTLIEQSWYSSEEQCSVSEVLDTIIHVLSNKRLSYKIMYPYNLNSYNLSKWLVRGS